MMMKIKLLLVICCLLLSGCLQQDSKDEAHQLLIDCLKSEDAQDGSSYYLGIIIFCNINDGYKLGYINFGSLQILYNHDSFLQKMGYQKFIEDVIHRKVAIDEREVEGNFILNKKIMSEYEKNPFVKFLSTYTKCVEKDRYAINSNLSSEEKMTVVYCLYQHNYYSGFDDYMGVYFSTKINKLIELQRSAENIEIELR